MTIVSWFHGTVVTVFVMVTTGAGGMARVIVMLSDAAAPELLAPVMVTRLLP